MDTNDPRSRHHNPHSLKLQRQRPRREDHQNQPESQHQRSTALHRRKFPLPSPFPPPLTPPGRPPPPHPARRINLDARDPQRGQRNRHPPGQSQQDELVAARGDQRAGDRHVQDRAGEQQVERSGRVHEDHGGEDDV